MGVSEVLYAIGHFVCRPFSDCSSCVDVLDRSYYSKTSPGVYASPQMFNRWENDVKHGYTRSRPLPSRLPPPPPPRTRKKGLTKRSTSSSSRPRSESSSNNPSYYSFEDEEERDRRVQFLFYGGSDPPTPTSRGGLAASTGYRSDMISDAVSLTSIRSPQINHEIPCFFSPRDTPRSSVSASMYSPHVFKITEQKQRRNARLRSMRSFK
uniref:Uncharacterized protein n=1 Tax=Hyaloperonospora arabidopsidis (strain Emoy2) TaxID=559515 RepID=M4B5F9_HYAAE